MSRRGSDIRVGTYGFAYKEWVGPFYPTGTREADKLPYYAGVFSAVEMVHTYYGAPKPNAVERWRDQTPDHFKISIKVPRWVPFGVQSAAKRGDATDGGAAEKLANVLDVLRPLGPRLGPLVLQFDTPFVYPSGFQSLRAFVERWAAVSDAAPLAIDFRHPSWFGDGESEALLKQHDVAWVWSDLTPQDDDADRLPRAIDDPAQSPDTSSKFVYVRLSGSHSGKKTHYTPREDRGDELRRWAKLIKQRLAGAPPRTAYVVISDHYAGVGPDTAREMQALLRP